TGTACSLALLQGTSPPLRTAAGCRKVARLEEGEDLAVVTVPGHGLSLMTVRNDCCGMHCAASCRDNFASPPYSFSRSGVPPARHPQMLSASTATQSTSMA